MSGDFPDEVGAGSHEAVWRLVALDTLTRPALTRIPGQHGWGLCDCTHRKLSRICTNPQAWRRCLTGTSRSDHLGRRRPETLETGALALIAEVICPTLGWGHEHPWQSVRIQCSWGSQNPSTHPSKITGTVLAVFTIYRKPVFLRKPVVHRKKIVHRKPVVLRKPIFSL